MKSVEDEGRGGIRLRKQCDQGSKEASGVDTVESHLCRLLTVAFIIYTVFFTAGIVK